MKLLNHCLLTLTLLAVTRLTHGAIFTPGNLVVYRVGSGTGNEVNSGNPVFLDEYTTAGAFVQSIALPTTKSLPQWPLIASGTATSEGLLTRSVDGRYLICTGYGTNTGGTSLSGTTSTNVPRVIGRVDSAGNVDTSTALTDWTSGNNPRSAASVDGTGFWGAGAGGLVYAAFGSTTATALTNANGRIVNIYNNQLYLSGAAATARNLNAVGTGLPTSGQQPLTVLTGVTNSSPYGFAFFTLNGGPGPDTLYVADDNTNGIVKYSLVDSTWVSNGKITATAIRGLCGSVSGGTVSLYGTTGGGGAAGGGSIYAVTDTAGYNAAPSSGAATTMATAAANTAFRGIAFAPVAPPAITLLGADPFTNECHTAFSDPGALNSAGFDVTTNSTVNVDNPGTYSVTYTGTNSVGYSVSASRTVVVLDTTAPVITVLGENPFTNAFGVTFVEPGATSFDTCADGSVPMTTNSTVDVNVAGTYTNTFIATDSAGNSTTNTRVVVVVPPPVITLLGADLLTNECHSAFIDPGANNSAGFPVVISGSVNPNSPGTYVLTYTGTNAYGNSASLNRSVVVLDTLAPVITVLGVNPFTNAFGVAFVEPGAISFDTCADGAVPLTTNSTVNVHADGTYTNTFIATDSSGNSVTNTRLVVVLPNPVIIATNPPVLMGLTQLGDGAFQFNFTNLARASFTVFTSTNVALPFEQWSNLGAPVEAPAGTFQFTDPQATNNPQRFYRVRSP